jgi:hypothetical protein
MKNKQLFCQVLISVLFILSGKLFVQAEPVIDEKIIMARPSFLSATVTGDRAKFEEDNWTSRNASGGIESLTISKQLNKEDSLDFEGKAIAGNNDYLANLTLAREGLGSLTFAFKEFRKYYDPTGGYYAPFGQVNNPVEPNNDLHMDIGNFKIEGILAKEDSPEYSLSYERNFRSGNKSLLGWGGTVTSPATVQRQVYPSTEEIHEIVDRVKAGVKYVTKTSEVSAEQVYERTKSKNEDNYREAFNVNTGALTGQNRRLENYDSDFYSTILRGFKDLNDKLAVSCGVLYNHYKGGSLGNMAGTGTGATNKDNPASLEQNSTTIFPTISFKPFKDLSMIFGSKAEFIDKNGDSNPSATTNTTSNTYQKIFTENLQLKYSGIKNIALYANGSFEKKLIRDWLKESATDRKTNSVADTNNFTLGAKWYPISKVNITLEENYKNKFIDNSDEFDSDAGYRGYIQHMDLSSNRPKLKLNYKPFRWMAYTLGYTYEDSTYGVRTKAGGSTEIAKNKVHAYSVQAILTPLDSLYVSLFYERKNDFTSTRANGAGGATVATQQPDYKANVDVLGFDGSYALSKKTSLNLGYSMSKTDNFNNFSATGMPYGLDNFSQDASFGVKHALDKNSSLEFKCKYLSYTESSNNHANDYEAYLLSAAMNMVF